MNILDRLVDLRLTHNRRKLTPVRVFSCTLCQSYFWIMGMDGTILCAGCHAEAMNLRVIQRAPEPEEPVPLIADRDQDSPRISATRSSQRTSE